MVFEFTTDNPRQTIVYSDKRTSFSLSYDGIPVDYFDREGRLVGMFIDGHHYRRGLDNRLLEKYRSDDGRQRIHSDVEGSRKTALVSGAYDRARAVRDAVEAGGDTEFKPQGLAARIDQDTARTGLLEHLSTLGKWSYDRLSDDGNLFGGIYEPVSILPPDQYLALIVQMTIGCSYNKCTFCDFYQDRPFSIKSNDELRTHLQQLLGFFGESAWLRKSLFLLDGNALVVPQKTLLERLGVIAEFFECMPADIESKPDQMKWLREHPHGFDGMYAFLDAFSTLKKTVSDWEDLRMRSIRRVYLGLESGDDDVLQFIRKPGDRATMIDAAQTIKQAGVNVGVIAMVGVGGHTYADQHVANTVEAINEMGLGEGDIVYLSDFVNHPGLPYEKLAAEQNIVDLDWEQTDAQRETIKRGLRFADPKKPAKVTLYDIREMIY
jgi:radical SAM superfamily enzyme YgiQ (UPF0313 family)